MRNLLLVIVILPAVFCAQFNKSCSTLNIVYKMFKEDESLDVGVYGHDIYIETSSGIVHKDTFEDIPHVLRFMVYNSNFTSFDLAALQKMTYLESVDLMDVTGLPVLTNAIMLGYKSLSRLSIYHTDMKFDHNTFQNLIRLKYLSISRVDVAILGNEVFIGSMLEELYWTDSGIEKIDRYCFSPLGHIEIINLSGNKLPYLWPETFLGLKHLERLYLNRNRLTTLNFRHLEYLPSLRYLDVSQNKLAGIMIDEVPRSLPNLTTIILDKNSIERDHNANVNTRLRIVLV